MSAAQVKHGEIRLGPLDEWTLLLECPSGIYFDGIEGIAMALAARAATPTRFDTTAPPALALIPQIVRSQAPWAAWLDSYTGWILMPDNCD